MQSHEDNKKNQEVHNNFILLFFFFLMQQIAHVALKVSTLFKEKNDNDQIDLIEKERRGKTLFSDEAWKRYQEQIKKLFDKIKAEEILNKLAHLKYLTAQLLADKIRYLAELARLLALVIAVYTVQLSVSYDKIHKRLLDKYVEPSQSNAFENIFNQFRNGKSSIDDVKDHIVQFAEKKDGRGEKVKAEIEKDTILKNDIKINKEIVAKILAAENIKSACESKAQHCQKIQSQNNNLLGHDTEVMVLVNEIDKQISAAENAVPYDKEDNTIENIAEDIKDKSGDFSSLFDFNNSDSSGLSNDDNFAELKNSIPSPSAPDLPPDDTAFEYHTEFEPGQAIEEHESKEDIKEIPKPDYVWDEQPGLGIEPTEALEPGAPREPEEPKEAALASNEAHLISRSFIVRLKDNSYHHNVNQTFAHNNNIVDPGISNNDNNNDENPSSTPRLR